MKRAVSISIGSSRRNKTVEIDLCGECVQIERIGTDGNLQKAAQLYAELDGKVDALGVGGGLLGLMVGDRWYPMHSLLPLVKTVKQTPLVDGTGLKLTLERRFAAEAIRQLQPFLPDRKALIVTAVDRWGMVKGALDAGCQCTFGDVLYSLGMPVPLHQEKMIHLLAATLAPVITRLPFPWVYPVGKSQEKRQPRFEKYFQQASVIMGDCHYIWKYMPENVSGKLIITNTTTLEDVAFFKKSGARFLVTTTPVYDGRSFGTNMMEAAIVAAFGRKEPVDYANPGDYFAWIEQKINELNLTLQVQELTP